MPANRPPDHQESRIVIAGFNIGTGILRALAADPKGTKHTAAVLREWLIEHLSPEELVPVVDEVGFMFGGEFASIYFEQEREQEAERESKKIQH